MGDDRLAELYRAHGPVIYSRCRAMLRDDAAAEDAVQEVFVRVLRHLEAVPPGREALAFLYRVSTNLCLNALRDRAARPQPAGGDLPDLPGERPSGPFADRDLVRRLLERAPEKLRAVAWLHHVDGIDQGEVARVLGISRRTVVSRLAEFAARSRKFAQREPA